MAGAARICQRALRAPAGKKQRLDRTSLAFPLSSSMPLSASSPVNSPKSRPCAASRVVKWIMRSSELDHDICC